MFTKLEIQGFRGINHLVIDDLKRINIFVGENDCGKTTILESIYLITDINNAAMPVKLNNLRNLNLVTDDYWELFFHNLDVLSDIIISAKLSSEEERTLHLSPFKDHNSIKTMEINTFELVSSGPTQSGSIDSSEIGRLDLNYGIIKDNATKKITARITQKDKTLMFHESPDYKEDLKVVFLNDLNEFIDIAIRFDNIQTQKRMESIIAVLNKIEPSLVKLELGMKGIIKCDIGLKKLVPLNVLGDGIVKMLSILLSIAAAPNGIILIDEIENGFYRKSLEILWTAILNAAKEFNVQIFAATHSIECIDALCSAYEKLLQDSPNTNMEKDELRLFRIERKEDNSKAFNFNYEKLKIALEKGWEVR